MLKLGSSAFADDEQLIMAIVNRTPDSFYDKGATFEFDRALDRVRQVVADGAHIVDIGGVKAAPGESVSVAQEMERTVSLVAAVRAEFPDTVISVDTWRHEVGDAVCTAGADLLNDAWGGWDPELIEVAAHHGAAVVCTHTGGHEPRTRPHRVSYDDVITDVLRSTIAQAERAVAYGVSAESVLIDPAHDFGKNTRHSLEITRRLGELAATGWPVVVSVSNKDFVGETLDRPVTERAAGTQAATAICAWLGARVHRVHDVVATRQTLDMVATIKGLRARVDRSRACLNPFLIRVSAASWCMVRLVSRRVTRFRTRQGSRA